MRRRNTIVFEQIKYSVFINFFVAFSVFKSKITYKKHYKIKTKNHYLRVKRLLDDININGRKT